MFTWQVGICIKQKYTKNYDVSLVWGTSPLSQVRRYIGCLLWSGAMARIWGQRCRGTLRDTDNGKIRQVL